MELAFVQKSKMASAAIFELLFCNARPPTKPVCGPKLALQILHWSRYRDLKISQIWLKCLFRPPKIMFWGALTPKLYFLSSRPPKGTSLHRNTRFENLLVVIGPTVWSGRDTKCTKKERTKSKPKFAIFADLLPVVPHQPNFACGVVSQISFLVLSFKKIGWKMWEQWGVEFLAFPLTWHNAYTTACCYCTSCDKCICAASTTRAVWDCDIIDVSYSLAVQLWKYFLFSTVHKVLASNDALGGMKSPVGGDRN